MAGNKISSIDLGQKTLPVGSFTFGPMDVSPDEQGVSLTFQKIGWVSSETKVFTYQIEYTLDNGKTWISLGPLCTVSAKTIPAKFGNPFECLNIFFTVPGYGLDRQIRALLSVSRVCVMSMKASPKKTK